MKWILMLPLLFSSLLMVVEITPFNLIIILMISNDQWLVWIKIYISINSSLNYYNQLDTQILNYHININTIVDSTQYPIHSHHRLLMSYWFKQMTTLYLVTIGWNPLHSSKLSSMSHFRLFSTRAILTVTMIYTTTHQLLWQSSFWMF